MTPKEFAFLNATQEQKAVAWEWLKAKAVAGSGPAWFHAAVLLEELKKVGTPQTEVVTRLANAILAGDDRPEIIDLALAYSSPLPRPSVP